jgi:hypothetical protein
MAMSKLGQRICTFCGPVGFAFFGIGVWPVAHFLPPLSPAASAAEIAAIYRGNTLGILFGSVLLMLGVSLLMPFFAQWAVLMRRMEGENRPYMLTQVICAAFVSVLFFTPAIFWSVAAFRPERPDETIQLINDIAWIMLVIPAFPGFVQLMAIGLAVLGDKKPVPVMPRWVGFASLWVAVLFVPACVVALFKTGPFAWNGLLSFWVPAAITGLWANGMVFPMLKAIAQEPDTATA